MAREYKTKSRTLILQYLMEEQEHTVSIADIEQYLKEKNETISTSTIYRFLDKLISEKKVMKFQNEEGKKAVFQYRQEELVCHQHLHMQCVKCGRLIHMDCGFMKEISERMKEQYQFRIQCEGSILYGVCSSCE